MDNNQNIVDSRENNSNKKTNSGLYFFALLYRNKIFISSIVVISTIIAVVVSVNLKNEYVSTVNAVPPKMSGNILEGTLGNISSALKEFGMTKLSGKSEAGYSYLVILESRSISDSIIRQFKLWERYDIEDTNMVDLRKEFQNNIEISYEKAGNYLVSVWDTDPNVAADIANTIVRLANIKSLQLFREEAQLNREYLESRLQGTDSTLNYIAEELSKYSGKKLIFSPQEQAQSISSALSDLKFKVIESDILYQLYKNTYGENDVYTQMQKKLHSELQSQMADVQNKSGFAGNFKLSEAGEIGINFMKMYTEFETYSKVKAFLLPMLEQARLDEIRNIQSLFIVDEAIPSNKKDRPKRSFIILGTFVGSFVFAVLLILLINSIKTFKEHYNDLNSN